MSIREGICWNAVTAGLRKIRPIGFCIYAAFTGY
jgi:hypothetical protein